MSGGPIPLLAGRQETVSIDGMCVRVELPGERRFYVPVGGVDLENPLYGIMVGAYSTVDDNQIFQYPEILFRGTSVLVYLVPEPPWWKNREKLAKKAT
jgi:hypothetical protein